MSKPAVTVRPYGPADRAALDGFLAGLQDDGRRYDRYLAPGAAVVAAGYAATMVASAAAQQGRVFIAELDGRPVGYVACNVETEEGAYVLPEGARTTHVQEMFVAPAARRKGVARALLAAVEAQARAAGTDRLIVYANAANPESTGLYRAAGFDDYKIMFQRHLDREGSRG